MQLRALVVLVMIGCGSKEPAPAAPVANAVPVPDAGPPDAALSRMDIAVAKMVSFKDDMCKCLDKACADAVQDRMNRWAMDMAKQASNEPDKPASDEVVKKMTEVGQAYGECMVKAMGATP